MISTQYESASVIITTYNHARFLGEAIESVLAQTVKPAEIIVVDDGSTDDPASVVHKFHTVRLIRQKNQGLGAARNTGLEAARGKFIVFLDADDRLRPAALATNLALFKEQPECALVYGAYRLIGESGSVKSTIPLRAAGDDAFAGFLNGNLIGMHATVLYRRDILQDAGGFDPKLQACEDYDVYLRLSRFHKVACSPEVLADYRRHGSNMSNKIPKMLASALEVLGRQRSIALSSPQWALAYREGVDKWKRYYADMQLGQMSVALRSRKAITAQLFNTAAVLAKAPMQTAKMLRQRLKRWASRRGLAASIRFGDLERTEPFSTEFGFDRGKPVDRRYVEAFLSEHSCDICGRVLEIGDNAYTLRFGASRVVKSEVLNRYEGHPSTTFIGDLSDGATLPSDAFDCIVLTQTLHLLFDMPAAIETLWRVLKPGGVLLVTVPWVSPIDRGEWGDSWFWSLTPAALQRLLAEQFGDAGVVTSHYGNAYAGTGFLFGLAEQELKAELLDVHDPYCPVIVAARVTKQ